MAAIGVRIRLEKVRVGQLKRTRPPNALVCSLERVSFESLFRLAIPQQIVPLRDVAGTASFHCSREAQS